ncbi:hypothetical protein [Anaerobacillus alkaliphilus]|uniref:hypothetical protein n=1 Tax=Anaerobacillus alkaliphilus TaxID=1548597 RepID=UPI0013761C0E|nr:hypothetical protein [Anaerobacillus alkaliphilus]
MRSKKRFGLIGLIIFGGQFLFHLMMQNFYIEILVIALLFLGLYLYGSFQEKQKK